MNDAVGTLPVRLMLVDDHPLVRDGLRARAGRSGASGGDWRGQQWPRSAAAPPSCART